MKKNKLQWLMKSAKPLETFSQIFMYIPCKELHTTVI